MKTTRLSIIGIVAGLLASAPAFAQVPTGSGTRGVTTVQKQHTDGGDSPDNPRAFQKSTAQSLDHSDSHATNGSIAEKQ
jgi:hypothetical protein